MGLTCGGELDVLVQRVDPAEQPHLGAALAEVTEGRAAAGARLVDGPDGLLGATLGVLGDSWIADGVLDSGSTGQTVADRATALLRVGSTALVSLGGDADTCPERLSVLVHAAATRPRVLIFGAADLAVPSPRPSPLEPCTFLRPSRTALFAQPMLTHASFMIVLACWWRRTFQDRDNADEDQLCCYDVSVAPATHERLDQPCAGPAPWIPATQLRTT